MERYEGITSSIWSVITPLGSPWEGFKLSAISFGSTPGSIFISTKSSRGLT